MTYRVRRIRSGFTLAEACLALVFVTVMILGTLGFSYYGRLDAHKADLHSVSISLAELILNDWKAAGGSSTYDPIATFSSDFTISPSDVGLAGLDEILGRYNVLLDGNNFRVTLSYRDLVDDKPRLLNVAVAWIEHSRAWDDSSDPRRSVKLSGYVIGQL